MNKAAEALHPERIIEKWKESFNIVRKERKKEKGVISKNHKTKLGYTFHFECYATESVLIAFSPPFFAAVTLRSVITKVAKATLWRNFSGSCPLLSLMKSNTTE